MTTESRTSLEDFTPEQRDELARLYTELASNKDTREPLLRITRHIRPGTPMPEIEVKDGMRAAMQPLVEKLNATEKKLIERDARDNLEGKRSVLRDKGYTKEQVADIEKLMLDKHIADHATAAEHYDFQRQTATPTPSSFQMPRVPFPTKDEVKAAGGMKRHFLTDAHKAVDDLRAGRVKFH